MDCLTSLHGTRQLRRGLAVAHTMHAVSATVSVPHAHRQRRLRRWALVTYVAMPGNAASAAAMPWGCVAGSIQSVLSLCTGSDRAWLRNARRPANDHRNTRDTMHSEVEFELQVMFRPTTVAGPSILGTGRSPVIDPSLPLSDRTTRCPKPYYKPSCRQIVLRRAVSDRWSPGNDHGLPAQSDAATPRLPGWRDSEPLLFRDNVRQMGPRGSSARHVARTCRQGQSLCPRARAGDWRLFPAWYSTAPSQRPAQQTALGLRHSLAAVRVPLAAVRQQRSHAPDIPQQQPPRHSVQLG